jgi:hypothetical protein
MASLVAGFSEAQMRWMNLMVPGSIGWELRRRIILVCDWNHNNNKFTVIDKQRSGLPGHWTGKFEVCFPIEHWGIHPLVNDSFEAGHLQSEL